MKHSNSQTATQAPTIIIRVTKFQPFDSRIGIDYVMRLDFHFDPELIGHLKRILATYKTVAVDPSHNRHAPGGWLPREKCWFIELTIWDVVRDELQMLGYQIVEPASEYGMGNTP